ncbi:MAG: hypothetical protein JOZ80_20530 [Acidobacteriaceae bacterium]|nr:hypothetical protein [Acidobacteriaceae bacterium]
MTELCAKISVEKNPKKLIELTDDLISLLAKHQDAIKANISSRLSKVAGAAK